MRRRSCSALMMNSRTVCAPGPRAGGTARPGGGWHSFGLAPYLLDQKCSHIAVREWVAPARLWRTAQTHLGVFRNIYTWPTLHYPCQEGGHGAACTPVACLLWRHMGSSAWGPTAATSTSTPLPPTTSFLLRVSRPCPPCAPCNIPHMPQRLRPAPHSTHLHLPCPRQEEGMWVPEVPFCPSLPGMLQEGSKPDPKYCGSTQEEGGALLLGTLVGATPHPPLVCSYH